MKAKWKKDRRHHACSGGGAGRAGATSFYRVGQGEEALVLTFGRVTDTRVPACTGRFRSSRA